MEENNKHYSITKEECQNNIWGVCESCGGKPEPIDTVDNGGTPTFWVGCNHCSNFCSQTTPERFKLANMLVRDFGYYPYTTIHKPVESVNSLWKNYLEELDYFYRQEIRGVYPLIRFLIGQGYFELSEAKKEYNPD